METTTILNKTSNMYMVDDFSDITNQNLGDLNNKLFCTFTTLENLENLLRFLFLVLQFLCCCTNLGKYTANHL